ncbi:MAG: AAA family ATPase [Bacteroidota bacterium]
MRLRRIRPNYFRAFGDSEWINLNSPLVVIYGPNGFGKTSLAEALEWLIYGKTHRRTRGEQLSQRDYQGSYRNAHALIGHSTFVECEVQNDDGTTVVLRRDLIVGSRATESSATYIDGHPFDFNPISGNEIFYPIIAQHSLQDFIHSRPKDRRDKISAAFGLETLIRYKTVFDRARTRFQSSPPANVIVARQQLNQIIRAMLSVPRLVRLSQKWASGGIDLNEDSAELQRLARELLRRTDGDWSIIIGELTAKRAEAALRVFDLAPIQMPANYNQSVVRLGQLPQRVHQQVQSLVQSLRVSVTSAKIAYSQAQLQFWETGLILAPEGLGQCPMCESDTLTLEKRTELRQRIDQSSTFTQAANALRQESEAAAELTREVMRALRAVVPAFMNDQQRQALASLYEGAEDLCVPVLRVHDDLRHVWLQSELTLQQIETQLRTFPTIAADPATVEQSISFAGGLENNLVALIEQVATASELYVREYSTFVNDLERRISSSGEVREVEAYLAPINGWRNLQVIRLYNNLLLASLDLARRIEDDIQRKQAESFSSKGLEMNRWYDMMNPNAMVRYKRMEPGTDSLQLIGESFGVEINAVCLSQCQLNCLGLSVHLVRFLTPGTPFSFLLMDDPVQSMDDDHREALVINVISELLSTHGKQLIIMSHVQGLADSVWERYFHMHPLRLRISDFRKEGPIIEESETLQGCMARARHLAAGNEDNRRLALDCLRRGVELLIRAECRQTDSSSPPDDARARQMIPFFRTCAGTSTQQGNDLANTIGFADPAPHTQVGWAVPTQPQIVPHIDRVQGIAQRLGIW